MQTAQTAGGPAVVSPAFRMKAGRLRDAGAGVQGECFGGSRAPRSESIILPRGEARPRVSPHCVWSSGVQAIDGVLAHGEAADRRA